MTADAPARLGVATPQANPTVEAEMRRYLPDDIDYVTMRLVFPSTDSVTRLRAYLTDLPALCGQLGGMRIDSLLFACTASSYLVDTPTAAASIARAEDVLGAPVITATAALKAELEERGAARIALISPYPAPIMDAALAWWRASGFDVCATGGVDIGSQDTRRIYDLTADDAAAALAGLDVAGAEAIVLSGTGMPTASILQAEAARLGRPVISSNLALARQALGRMGRVPRTVGDSP